MSVDTEGLHRVANTNNHGRRADIVFVHGLRGASHSTWRFGSEGKSGHFFWPEELGKDLPDCGIWSIGYPAGLVALDAPGMILEKRAGNIAKRLANAHLGDRPLIFVTHSMGGLVIKSLLVSSQVVADPDRKRITEATAGIVFCATPHGGAGYADAARVLGIALGGAQEHVREMSAGREQLDILHDQFIEWHRTRRTPVSSYAENQGLFKKRWIFRPVPLGLVVGKASANPNIAGHSIVDVDDDHLSLVKPPDRDHVVYAGVLRFVRDTLSSPIAQEGSRISSLDVLSKIVLEFSHVQMTILNRVGNSKHGLYVSDLVDDLGTSRGEILYRAKDLQAQGLVKILSLTDYCIRLSEDLEKLKDHDRVAFDEIFAMGA